MTDAQENDIEVCLHNLHLLSEQTVFDTVAKHLLIQGEKAFDTQREECRYLADDGKMCAVGCLIADDEYRTDLEGLDVAALLRATGSQPSHYGLLDALQRIHDYNHPRNWEANLRDLAVRRGLNPDSTFEECTMSNSNPEFSVGDRVVVLAEPRYLVDQLDPSPGLEGLAGTVLDCQLYTTSPAHAPDYRIEFDDDPDGGLSKYAVDEPYLALEEDQ